MARRPGRPLKVRVKTARGRTPSQTQWLERQLNDPFVHEAKRLGLRARSAFKLAEIDDKYRILKPGMLVVDLGAAPGSWSQLAARRVRADEGQGRVVAIDLHGMDPIPGVAILRKDFLDPDAPSKLKEALGDGCADVVLSDMAAHATGHRQTDHLRIMALCEAALMFAREVLKPGGAFLCKVLRGGTEGMLLTDMKRDFAAVRHLKPEASRADSAELFVLASGFRGGGQRD
ncbi:MAG TPA: RlmE family RNA methyltransferase [Aestuariivirgaceae bacterium]|jgi:23S rRNA (uridine2552-2'-O)-methyltransferase